MDKHPGSLKKSPDKLFKLAAIAFTGIVLVLSLLPPRSFNAFESIQFQFLDKAVHLSIYAVLSFLWAAASYYTFPVKKALIVIAVSVSVYGILLEVLQLWAEGRSFEWADILCNILGAVLGTGIAFRTWKYE